MNRIFRPEKLYISDSQTPNAGRGVFTSGVIKKGTLIECCPIIEIPEYEIPEINKTLLVTYVYYVGARKERLWLALGFGSLYNHADLPNARYEIKLEQKVIDFVAIQDIQVNEEIRVNYSNANSKKISPLWFNTA